MRSRRKRLEDKDASTTKRPFSPEGYVLWLLGRREYSRAELDRKLSQKEVDEPTRTAVLDKIAAAGYQDDARVVQSQLRIQQGSGKGPAFIRAKLRQQGIDQEQVAEAMAEAQENVDWSNLAREAAQRKFGEGPYDQKTRNKLFNFLLRRGFSMDDARRACETKVSEE